MRFADLADLRVAVWGYGREGRAALVALQRRFPGKALALFCSEAEARELEASSSRTQSQAKTATDWPASRVPPASIAMDASRATPHLNTADAKGALEVITTAPDAAALARFDVVIKSPGISPYRAPYAQATALGARFVSGSALWFAEHAEAKTICITGTKGKSTVTALIAHLLRKSGRRVALAGNIGLPLLELIDVDDDDASAAPDWWVIELSSFQTRDFDSAPSVAVINNVYEEHLDWHLSRENYVADKLAIAARARHVVVNAEQVLLGDVGRAGARSEFNSRHGWHVRDAAVFRGDERMVALASIPLPGLHNAQNVCAALAAIEAAAVFESGQESSIAAAGDRTRAQRFAALAAHVTTFQPLPHRLQTLGVRDAITYVNDSISTTPYAAIEALRSLAGQAVTILVGGFDRGLSWQPFAEYVAAHPPHAVVAMGANREAIAALLCATVPQRFVLDSAPLLADAFARARAITPAGGAVLLSPGAPSFDQFHDYAERGREFARLAGFDPNAIAQIEGLGIT